MEQEENGQYGDHPGRKGNLGATPIPQVEPAVCNDTPKQRESTVEVDGWISSNRKLTQPGRTVSSSQKSCLLKMSKPEKFIFSNDTPKTPVQADSLACGQYNRNAPLNGFTWSSHDLWYFLIFPTWQHSPVTPNQEQKCFQKAFTESREPHRHKIHSGISYSGKEAGWKMWQMSAGRSEPESGERWWLREEEEGTLPSRLPLLPLSLGSTLFYLWRGWDGTSWRQRAKLNSETRLSNWGMFYPWIRLHGDCEWIILWSLIKESQNFEVGCSVCVFTGGVDTGSCLHDYSM